MGSSNYPLLGGYWFIVLGLGGTVTHTKENKIPLHLRSKVSSLLFLMADWSFRTAGYLIIGTGAFVLFTFPGNVSGTHSLSCYLLGPLSPALPALWYTLRPFKPYRGNPFSQGGARPVDQNDPAVMRLVELFRSHEGKRALWRSAAKESAILYLFAVVFAVLNLRPLNWDLDPLSIAIPIGFGSLFSLVWFGTDYVSWGMRTWIQREASRHGCEAGATQARSQY